MKHTGKVQVSARDEVSQSLLVIQTGFARTPVFCVPGSGASVTAFTDFTAALGPEWPIYGVQPRGLDGWTEPHSSVEAAATAYVQAIANAPHQGALHLFGHSFGGWVAFEMALQLCATGRAVASVTILDSDVPGEKAAISGAEERSQIMMQLVRLYEQSVERPLGLVATDFESLDESAQLELLHRHLVRAGIVPGRSEPGILRGVVRTFAKNLGTTYFPATYSGTVCLMLVDSGEEGARTLHEQRSLGWRRFAPQLVEWHVTGNHMTALKRPHVNRVAAGCLKIFTASWDRTQARRETIQEG